MKTLAEVNLDELSKEHGIPETERPMGVLLINQNIVGVIVAAGLEPKYAGDNRGYIHVKLTPENHQNMFYNKFGLLVNPCGEFKGEIVWTNFLMNGEIAHYSEVRSLEITNLNMSSPNGITITCRVFDEKPQE